MKHPETACVLFAGRLFDFHVLDMIELGIEKFSSLSDIKVLVSVLYRSLHVLSAGSTVLHTAYYTSSLNHNVELRRT